MLLNRTFRDKIPSVADLEGDKADAEARANGQKNKQKGKESGDHVRRATPSDIAVGDRVVVKNQVKEHKLTTRFGQEEYIVESRTGSEVSLSNGDTTMRRHVTQVRKISTIGETEENITKESQATRTTGSLDGEAQDINLEGASQIEARVPPLKFKKKGRSMAA